MVDVSTPHDGSKSSFEIISSEYHVRDLLSSRASTTHSKCNISSMESINISNSATSDGNLLVLTWEEFLKSFNDNVSMSWSSFGKYSKICKYSGKCSGVITVASGFIESLSMHDHILLGSGVLACCLLGSSISNLGFGNETNL